ncbi:VgrG-related protein (plasmid) [Streptomyces murinus]|uniref:VgrG-related protein n=1 Tax=Streptomyces murinus TaxID=33900 RepID=UPI000A1FDCE3|nr:VgrG-related protein [Streptomyces murinus]WDO11324.1 VgrG-related protein [Streptomyces murinus]
MTGRTYSSRPSVCIGTTTLDQYWLERLVEVFVDTGTNRPAEAYLRFRDSNRSLYRELPARIGTPMTVAAVHEWNRTETPVFDGEITSLEMTHTPSEGTFSIVRAKDRAHRLSRGRHVTAYADTTVARVVEEIANRARLSPGTVEADNTVIPHLSQPNLTDWELLQHLATERGLTVAVEKRKEEGKKKDEKYEKYELCLRKHTSAGTAPFDLVHNRNLLSLQAALTSTGQVAKVQVHGWDPKDRRPLTAAADATHSERILRNGDHKEPWAFGHSSTLLVTSRPYASAHEVETAAKALASDTAAASTQLTAVAVGTPQLTAEKGVTLSGVGLPFEGKYTVTTCRHVFSSGDYRTEVTVSAAPSSLVPPAPPLSITGLATGLVSAINGESQNGEVKLKFPWLGEEYETGWVRTLQYGGFGGGGVIPYELHDEVLVGFEQGRLDHPVVVGGLYNGKNKPSDHEGLALNDKETHKANRRSLASRDGDRIEIITPAEGTQGIRLTTGKDNEKLTVLLDRNKKAITLTAGTGEDNLSLLLDYANKSAALATAGADGKKLSLLLDHEQERITLDAGQGTLTLKAGTVEISSDDVNMAAQKAEWKVKEINMTGAFKVEESESNSIAIASTGITVTGKKVKIDGETDIN